jgi:hypothetical protein
MVQDPLPDTGFLQCGIIRRERIAATLVGHHKGREVQDGSATGKAEA